MSSFNAFVSCNQWRYFISHDFLNTAPAAPTLPAVYGPYLTTQVGGTYYTWDCLPSSSGHPCSLLLRIAGPYTPGQQPDFKHAVYSVHTTYQDFSVLIPPGSVPTLAWYGFYGRIMDDITGQSGPWTLLHAFTQEYIP
jgi:hypothetical protein